MRARGVVVTVAVLLLPVLAAVTGEVVVGTRTQHQVADTVAAALGADPATTSVDLGSGPVLPQLMRGRLDRVDVVAPEVVLDAGTFTDVTARATGVRLRAPYTAETVTATGIVPPETIREQIAARGLDLDAAARGDGAPDGSLRASGSLLGVGWGVALVPRVEGGHLLVDVVAADVAGVDVPLDALPSTVRDALTGLQVPLAGLPAGLSPTAARVVPTGVAVTLEGTDVPLDAAG